MPDDYRYRDEAWLREQYAEKDRSLPEIADAVGASKATIHRWMDKHDIQRNPAYEGGGEYRDAEWLREQYWAKGLSAYQIAEKVDCTANGVKYWMEKHGIETRPSPNPEGSAVPKREMYKKKDWLRSQIEDGELLSDIGKKCDVSESTISRWVLRHGIDPNGTPSGDSHHNAIKTPPEDVLRRLYKENKATLREIATKYNVSPPTVRRWLQNHDIELRTISEATPSGKDSHFYKHGQHDYDYGASWRRKRRAARKRDGFECQDCGIGDREHKEIFGEELHVHHIERISSFDSVEDANQLDNLITLCRDCHLNKWEPMSPMQPQTVG